MKNKEVNMDKKTEKQVIRYIDENLSKGYSVDIIRKTLIKYGYNSQLTDYLMRTYMGENKGGGMKVGPGAGVGNGLGAGIDRINKIKIRMPNHIAMIVLLSVIVLVGSESWFIGYYGGVNYGLAIIFAEEHIITEEFDYTDEVDLEVNSDYEYTWVVGNYGALSALSLEGTVSKKGSARIYLEHEDERYLIFDNSRLSEDIPRVLVGESEPLINESKSIITRIEGGGKKAIDDVFEFDVYGEFNWSVDYSKVCTRFSVNSVGASCYGFSECCSEFVGLAGLGNWNDKFYLSYERYGAGLENTVSAQVIYYDVNLSVPYSDIVISGSADVSADFYDEISFTNVCLDTCSLPELNGTSYRLVFEVEDANLSIDNIEYIIEEETIVKGTAPVLVEDIKDIVVYKNGYAEMDLSTYFRDNEYDSLTYSVNDVEDIDVIIDGSVARILPDYNFTGKVFVYFTASDEYYDASSNVFSVDVVERPLEAEDVEVSEELIKPRVEINKPVKWVKKVSSSDRVINLRINISPDALNVSVKNVRKGKKISEDKLKVDDGGVIKEVGEYRNEKRVEQIDKIDYRLEQKILKIAREDPTATGKLSEINKELLELKNERNKLTGYAAVNSVEDSSVSVIIEEIVEEIEVEYWTEGPISEESNIVNGKKIVVSSDIHYEDILAYTLIEPGAEENAIKLYWIVNGTRQRVEFAAGDDNNNGLVDYINWTIPSLSNATYEVIIEIIKAEHLDVNRVFIADIYDYVKEQDDVWSTPVNNNEYVRVTFEQELDNTKDITLYARSDAGAQIEVYEFEGSEVIARFENISSEDLYKVYLSDLTGVNDVFDLKIIGSVEFDYIVDPPGNERYLDASATGANDGTSWQDAWTTLSSAQNYIGNLPDKGAGTTIYMRNGSYGWYNEGYSRIDWLTWKADAGHKPEFSYIRVLRRGSNVYLRFDGVFVNPDGSRLDEAVHVKGNYFEILNSEIRHLGYSSEDTLKFAMYLDSNHFKIDRNEIHHAIKGINYKQYGYPNVDHIEQITNNYIHDIGRSFILAEGVSKVNISYNHLQDAAI